LNQRAASGPEGRGKRAESSKLKAESRGQRIEGGKQNSKGDIRWG
jgi:hypothetical protein